MVQRDAPKMAPRDALALSAHLNLGTGQNGTAGDAAIEKRILRWVSLLLYSKFQAKLLICFGLWGLIRKEEHSELWASSGGLAVAWNKPDAESAFGKHQFRLWKARRADGQPMAVLMWPNHPSRPPFAGGPDGVAWKAAKRQADRFLKKQGF
jgi:hypothetical protein